MSSQIFTDFIKFSGLRNNKTIDFLSRQWACRCFLRTVHENNSRKRRHQRNRCQNGFVQMSLQDNYTSNPITSPLQSACLMSTTSKTWNLDQLNFHQRSILSLPNGKVLSQSAPWRHKYIVLRIGIGLKPIPVRSYLNTTITFLRSQRKTIAPLFGVAQSVHIRITAVTSPALSVQYFNDW